MKQVPNQFLMAVLTSVVGLLVTNAWLGYENIEQVRQGSLAASRNRSVIVALENIISLVTEAESGQRGYLITGEPEYLEPYRKALANIDGQIKFLEHATANNPAQRARIPELKRRIESRLQQLQQRIDVRAGKGIDAAREAILVNRGKVEMDSLRQHVAVKIESEVHDGSVQRSAHNYNVALSSSLIVANHLYKQKIDLRTGFDVEFPQIYIDAKQLEQVLVNLYLNTITAMLEIVVRKSSCCS